MHNLALMMMLAFAAGVAISQEVDEPVVKEPAVDDAARTAEQVADATDEAKKPGEYTPPSGYRVKVRDGETVYCRKEQVLGTRFPQEFCFSRLELKEIERRKRSMQDDVAQRQRMCTTGSACSGGG